MEGLGIDAKLRLKLTRQAVRLQTTKKAIAGKAGDLINLQRFFSPDTGGSAGCSDNPPRTPEVRADPQVELGRSFLPQKPKALPGYIE